MTDDPTITDDDITEDTLDREQEDAVSTEARRASDRITGMGDTANETDAAKTLREFEERRAASEVQRAATRAKRLAKRAECDADRTLAVALLYEAVHRAENFAHEIVVTERMLAKLRALAQDRKHLDEYNPEQVERDEIDEQIEIEGASAPPPRTETADYSETIALLEARKEVAEEALPALLDIRAHRKRLVELTNLANDLEEPSTEELWTAGAAALTVSPFLFAWRYVVAKDEAANAATDPVTDPRSAAPTP